MTATALDFSFELNPKFRYTSRVHWDELDPLQMLHNSRFAAHVERAVIAFYESAGYRWTMTVSENPDQFHVVRDFHIEFLAPVARPGDLHVEIWVEHLGTTSCIYGFRCTSQDGAITHARGNRTIIKLDPETKRPAAWTDSFQRVHREIRKDLPAAP
ncbi:MAG TPA: thioesterase family protein [Thermoanaerobaculia bacterium]|nr:thioesterase family protein [Thermoanaerobaculia bacterium]